MLICDLHIEVKIPDIMNSHIIIVDESDMLQVEQKSVVGNYRSLDGDWNGRVDF